MKIGDAEIRRVEEMVIRSSVLSFTEDRALIEAHRHWLSPHFLSDDDRWANSFQSFIIVVDGKITVVDPCTGNGRPHELPIFADLDTPYIERFYATGFRPENVDHVVCTHLHHDHCGWNTQLRDGRYVPTFPRARYLLARREVTRWHPDTQHVPAYPWNAGVFERSVLPVLQAGLADLIDGAHHPVSPSLSIEPAPGHTLAHQILHLASAGREAYFTGDVFHHPLQLVQPELQFGPADDLEQAIASRRRVIELAIERDALLIPAHLPAPHGLRISRANDAICFTADGFTQESTSSR